jgi:phage baseplate assembly protein W
MPNNSTYRDLSLDFATHPITGDVVVKSDVQAVLQSIRNLILTSEGDILWEPNIGAGIGRLMFELNDTMLKMQLFDKITNTINRFEPRIELSKLEIKRFDNGHGVYINIEFYMLNNPEPISETIAIKRIR